MLSRLKKVVEVYKKWEDRKKELKKEYHEELIANQLVLIDTFLDDLAYIEENEKIPDLKRKGEMGNE